MSSPARSGIWKKDYNGCLKYIEKHWKEITFLHPQGKYIHLGLPHKFISPNNSIYSNDQFYWDSYFIILGLVKSGRARLAKGIIDNFLYMHYTDEDLFRALPEDAFSIKVGFQPSHARFNLFSPDEVISLLKELISNNPDETF
jgi:hypothetical protein